MLFSLNNVIMQVVGKGLLLDMLLVDLACMWWNITVMILWCLIEHLLLWHKLSRQLEGYILNTSNDKKIYCGRNFGPAYFCFGDDKIASFSMGTERDGSINLST